MSTATAVGSRRRRFASLATLAAVAAGVWSVRPAQGRVVVGRPGGGVGPDGQVMLPYGSTDNAGNVWRIYPGGWLQQQGNMPVYSQGAMLFLNGAQLNQGNNQARLDEKSGELVMDNLVFAGANAGITVTRRILIDGEQNLVRYVDILKNTGRQEQTVQVQLRTGLNYGINQSQTVPDPKAKDQSVAWVAQTGAGASVVEVWAGKGSKTFPTINAPPGNSMVSAGLPVTIGPGKEAAIVHLHATVPTQDAGVNLVNNLKEADILKSLPKEVRRVVVNFRVAPAFGPDLELLRGDLLDVVETRGGDQFRGTLKEEAFALKTFYGDVRLPVDRVVAMVNVGRFRPRQLVVTADGQIFGGTLSKQTVDLQLSSGQVTQIPLSQVTRVGYRRRAGEPEEWTFERPMVLLRTGERVAVAMPSAPLEVQTRYGRLALPPASVASVALQSDEHGVHEVTLTDGSRFAGLLAAEQLDLALDPGEGGGGAAAAAGTPAQPVSFRASTLAKVQFNGKEIARDDDAPSLQLANDDVLVGTLTGRLKLDTAFDTITVDASEVRQLTHPGAASLDVAITLWDGTTLGGQLQEPALAATLGSGVRVEVPVALVVRYEQPQPQPAPGMLEQIKATIGRLNVDDWKERDRAEAQLVGMGPVAIGTLRKLKPGQPPEAQQRIESVLKQLEKQRAQQKRSARPQPNVGGADFEEGFIEPRD